MKLSNSWLRVLSSLSTNMSAGAFGLVVISPSILNLTKQENFFILTGNLIVGILLLLVAVRLDENIK